jgi:hypothetical protein
MKKDSPKTKISYEPEADVLRVEVASFPIDYAAEVGNVVVHFSKKGLPVYLEVLEATKFLKQFQKVLSRARVPEFAK